MAKRGSNIYKRKDGRFEGRVHVGYKADGLKKYRSVYGKTLADLKRSEYTRCIVPNFIYTRRRYKYAFFY